MSVKASLKRFLLNTFPKAFAKYAPTYTKPYAHYWADESGKQYRERTYTRQKEGGEKPLVANPTVKEIREVFDVYTPESILELGCGWGRLLEALSPYYHIEGCDLSDEYLARAPEGIRVFKYDVVKDDVPGEWDIVFTRAVMQYFINDEAALRSAMQHMERMAKKKVIVWEWPHVAEAMRKAYPSEKFAYMRMAYKDE